MSSLTEKMKQQLADLRRQYNEGELTGDQLSALMLQAIETEAAKPAKEMNDAWLTACSELMASADQDKLAKVSDHAERIRSKLVEAIRKDQKVQQRRLTDRMATAAACFLIIFAGVFFSKQWFMYIIALILLTAVLPKQPACAEAMPLSSDSFTSTSVRISASGTASFSAAVRYPCNISVSSCTLQKQENGHWVFAASLTPPPGKSNAIKYSAKKDYSSDMISGFPTEL